MSKKKDRANTDFRYCPRCGKKGILNFRIKKLFKEDIILKCYSCNKNYIIKETKEE